MSAETKTDPAPVSIEGLLARPEKPKPAPAPEPPKATPKDVPGDPSPPEPKKSEPKKSLTTMSVEDQLNALLDADAKPKAPPAVKPAPKKELPAPPKDETPDDTPEPPAKDEPPATPEPPKILRQKLVDANKEVTRLKEELNRIRLAPKDDPEKVELKAKLDEARQRTDLLETELKFTAYQRSSEFKEKYQAPLEKAYEKAVRQIKRMAVVDSSRMGTPEDLVRLSQMDDLEATEKAKELFGESGATIIMRHIWETKDLMQTQQEAIDDYQKKGAEREKQRATELTQNREQLQRSLTAKRQELEDTVPELFAADKEDPDGNHYLETGHQLVDLAFNGNPKATPDQMISAITEVRLRAASWGRVVNRLNLANEEIKALKEKLAKYEETEPGAGDTIPPKPSHGKSHVPTVEEDLDAAIASTR